MIRCIYFLVILLEYVPVIAALHVQDIQHSLFTRIFSEPIADLFVPELITEINEDSLDLLVDVAENAGDLFKPIFLERIIVLSIPKSGTHLAGKAIQLITGKTACYDAGKVDWSSNYYPTHELQKMMRQHGVKVIIIMRDPRDRLVSFINALEKQGYRTNMKKSLDSVVADILTSFRFGFLKNYGIDILPKRNIYTIEDYYYHMHHGHKMPTFGLTNCYVTAFEKLVGPLGGGGKEDQLQEIRNIAKFLNRPLSDQKIEEIADDLFGGTVTFFEGRIGSWKNFFSPHNKELLKKSLGSIPITLGYEQDYTW